MGITNFYTETLGANLAGVRWSWGATNPNTNQIFLRVWEDELETVDGVERSMLFRPDWQSSSNGLPERKRHIEALKQGAAGYGVICTAAFDDDGNRTIAAYDDSELLVYGDIIEDSGAVYGVVTGRVAVAAIRRPRSSAASVVPDLAAIQRSRIEKTEKETLASARVGQGLFRGQVLALWDSRCCVTGTQTLDAVRASHIKPWRASSDRERLDPENGLPLVATLDALFDAGLVSFDTDGKMLVSDLLGDEERKKLQLGKSSLASPPSDGTSQYLLYHRDNIFRQADRERES